MGKDLFAPAQGPEPRLWCQDDIDLRTLFDGLSISKKAKAQFQRSLVRPRTAFLNHVIFPFMWSAGSANPAEHSYICLSDCATVPGRNHQFAQTMASSPRFGWYEALAVTALFTNALSVDYANPSCDPERWTPPSQRVVGGGPVVFTVEFDVPEVAFFERQMAWCRSAGKRPEDAPMGAIFREFSQFPDFLGLTVNWSGNKSLHIHAVFDSEAIWELTGLDRRAMRAGFQAHWDLVAQKVTALLGVPDGVVADRALRHPEAFRRLPWGAREIDKPNLLGIPLNMKVPQIVLWEQWRGRAANGAKTLFFRPDLFVVPPEVKAKRSLVGIGGRPVCGSLSEPDRLYCQQRLDEEVKRQVAAVEATGPILYRLEFDGRRWIAKLTNSASDSKPSSIMREDHNRVLLCGRDAATAAHVQLPYPLGVMMKLWLAQRDRPTPQLTIETYEYDGIRNRPLTMIEQDFQVTVVDKETAIQMTRKAVYAILATCDRAIVKGPEGSGKTRAVFTSFRQLMHRYSGVQFLDGSRGPIHAMFAFADYSMAEKKAQEFNNLHQRGDYRAVVLRSFEREYQEACAAVGVAPFTTDEAFGAGHDHLYGLIKAQQSSVATELKRRHSDMWREVGAAKPVFFTVHGVAEQWSKWGFTRVWWHRDFHAEFAQKTHKEMKWEMRLCLLVYDEVSVDTFIMREREEVVSWVDRLRADQPSWRRSTAKVRDRWKAFATFVAKTGQPQFQGKSIALSFREAQEIAAGSKRRREMVEVRCSGEYARSDPAPTIIDIYQQVTGRRWCVMPRNWWEDVASKVLVLTTEVLPTLVAERLGWPVYELECPKVEQNLIHVHLERSVSAANVGKVIADFRAKRRDVITVISNRAKTQPDTHTHHAAKGDNGFIGQNLAQTMLHVNPDEYESLEVINAWAATDRAVRLRHLDELNQTAGRNLGFRWDGKAEHHLLISHSLFMKLWDVLFEVSRYGFRINIGASKRYEMKRRTA